MFVRELGKLDIVEQALVFAVLVSDQAFISPMDPSHVKEDT